MANLSTLSISPGKRFHRSLLIAQCVRGHCARYYVYTIVYRQLFTINRYRLTDNRYVLTENFHG